MRLSFGLFLSAFLVISCGPTELSPEEGAPIPVTDIILNPCNITLPEGGTKTIVPTIKPTEATNKTIKWWSTNPSVATVSPDGTVTALLAGRGAMIVAEAVDGGKKAYCSVSCDAVFTVNTVSAEARYTTAIITGELSVSSHYEEDWTKEGFFLYSRTASTVSDLVVHGTKSSASFEGKKFSVNLMGLQDGEDYYYVACTKLLDKISYGDVKRFTTKTLPERGAVDMGLSVLWHQCNVGAAKPEDYGEYYAWGETEPKTTYSWSNYKFRFDDNYTLTKYVTNGKYGAVDGKYGTVDGKTVLDQEDDVAHVKLSGRWRMPTAGELGELLHSVDCSWQEKAINGVRGYQITSKITGNAIFLPGWLTPPYWSSTLYEDKPTRAYAIQSNSKVGTVVFEAFRADGRLVRPVCEY